MSAFIGAAMPVNFIGLVDIRLNAPSFMPISAIFTECVSAIAPASFETEFWPGAGFIGDGGADVGLLEYNQHWGSYYPAGGASSRYGFVGITRDQFGTPVAGCTVRLFRTSDNLLIDSTTSGPDGAFLLNTAYYPDAHYIVSTKSGSPNLDGKTPETLIGA